MFPLRDDIPSSRLPVVNYTLIGLCVAVYLMQMSQPDGGDQFIGRYGMVPVRVVQNNAGELATVLHIPQQLRNGDIRMVEHEQIFPALTIPPWMTMFTCMFLHGSLMHIIGNLWFLIIFGDNVEDRFGHLPYLLMYLLSGLAAGVLHIATGPSSAIPTVGASGAIAGVMGAYLLLYPHARVVTLIPLGVFSQTTLLPAPVFLGIWFVFQFASAAFSDPGSGGVAFWAHVGGFIAGMGLAWQGRQAGWLMSPDGRRNSSLPWDNRFF